MPQPLRGPTLVSFRARCALALAEAEALLLQWGRNELEEKSKPKWKLLAEQARCSETSHAALLNRTRTVRSSTSLCRA